MDSFEIIIGSYEGLSLGYVLENAKEGKLSFVTSFTDHSHTSSVKAVAVSCNGLVASGSADETIKLFNMDKRVELGSLLHHQGSVTGLSFFGNSHMFSCSEDGTIAVWQTSSWECLRTLRGHKSAVYSFSIHPSGKLALSCGKDKTLRTWNLMTGHCAYISNLKEAADIVLWSPDGIHYITVIGTRVTIYRFQTGAVIFEIYTDWRISSAAFLMSDLLAIGCERGMIFVYDLKNFEKVCELQTGTSRVKTMITLLSGQPSLVIVSSDGFVQLYHFDLEPRVKFTKVAELSSGFRLLCATARHISTKNSNLVATISTNIEQSSDADKNSSNIKRKQQLSSNTERSSKKRKSSDKSSL